MTEHVPDLRYYYRVVANRLWLLVVFIGLAVGGAYGVAGRTAKEYAASATLQMTAPLVAPAFSVVEQRDESFRPPVNTVGNDIMRLASSYPIAARVAERLKLPGAHVVQSAIQADQPRNTSLMLITAKASDPELAANMANTTAEEFVSYFREINRAGMTEVRKFTEQRLALARARLEASDRALQAFKERRELPALNVAVNQIADQVTRTEAEIDAAARAQRETDARLAVARARIAQEQQMVVSARSTSESQVFQRLRARLTDLEVQKLQLEQVYTAQHPQVQQIGREIAEVRGRLATEARTAIGSETTSSNPIHARLLSDIVTLEVERAALSARVQALQMTQRRQKATANAIPSAEAEFNRLTREHRVLESDFTFLSGRYQEAVLRENQAGFFPASLQLIEAARPPQRPMPSPFPKTAAAAAAAGLVLGIVAAFVLDSSDDRIQGAADAERVLGVPVLAQIPTHGEQPRTVPTAVIIIIGVVLALTLAFAAVARGYVTLPSGEAVHRLQVAADTVAAWVDELRVGPRAMGDVAAPSALGTR